MKTKDSVVLRAIAIVEAVARWGEGVSLNEIAETAGVPRPTAYRLVRELADAGVVRRDTGSRGGFSPGPRLEQLALALMKASGTRAARQAVLARLVAELGETCNVTILDGDQVLYVDRVETASPLRVHLQPGSRVPLHCTASGKLFLANLPKARRERLLSQGPFEAMTERTLNEPGTLGAELARIRKQGYAMDDEEYVTGLRCVAVPVADASGKTIAAVAVQAPVVRLSRDKALLALPALKRAARALAGSYDAGRGRRAGPDSP